MAYPNIFPVPSFLFLIPVDVITSHSYYKSWKHQLQQVFFGCLLCTLHWESILMCIVYFGLLFFFFIPAFHYYSTISNLTSV